MVYVKTTYGERSKRLPDISKYPTEKDAKSFIRICLRWGIDIVDCETVSVSETRRLIAAGKAETLEKI